MRTKPAVDFENRCEESVWVPPWLEGETLYGLCSRFHRIAGQRLASLTSTKLFGHPTAGTSHDLPGAVSTLTWRTNGRLGTARQVVLERTVLGYYLKFRPQCDWDGAITQLLYGGPDDLKARLGWLATRMGAAHPLCACDQCMQEDEKQHGIATWHLVHQLPGVWVCPVHGLPLWLAKAKTHGNQRFQWLLPDEIPAHDRQIAFTSDWPVGSPMAAAFLAKASAWFLARGFQGAVDLDRLRAALRYKLIERGLASVTGRLRQQAIEIEFGAFLDRFRRFPESQALCLTGEAASTSLRRTVRDTSRPMHPIRYLVAASWLFNSFQDFVCAYQTDLPSQTAPPAALNCIKGVRPDQQEIKSALVFSIQNEGLSVRAAARKVGVSVQTGLVWASAAGMAIQHRPKRVTPLDRMRIASALAAGRPKKSIAARFQLSVVTVTRILLSKPGLPEARASAITQERLVKARHHVDDIIRRQPSVTVIALRRQAAADVTWLYRHDRSWLITAFNGLKGNSKPRPIRKRVNWEARDAEFSNAIRKLKLDAASKNAESNKNRSNLIHAVPGLITKIKHLERMPLTRAALEFSN